VVAGAVPRGFSAVGVNVGTEAHALS
jgi:hypothetical protein